MSMLREEWTELATKLSIPHDTSAEILGFVESKYGEPWRRYHTSRHIEELLSLSRIHRDLIKDRVFMTLSIIFHDIEYNVDSRSADNEKDSEIIFRQKIASFLSAETMNKVSDAILRTKTHVVPEDSCEDLKLFMDFDMAILGSRRKEYVDYARSIRLEYGSISAPAYCSGRSSFFRNYLNSTPHIYCTALFRETHEGQARDNIAWECSILESGRLIEGEIDILLDK